MQLNSLPMAGALTRAQFLKLSNIDPLTTVVVTEKPKSSIVIVNSIIQIILVLLFVLHLNPLGFLCTF